MDLGIIGLARSGKTSLFNAVTRGQAQVGAYSSQSEPNVGIARVPDARVDALAATGVAQQRLRIGSRPPLAVGQREVGDGQPGMLMAHPQAEEELTENKAGSQEHPRTPGKPSRCADVPDPAGISPGKGHRQATDQHEEHLSEAPMDHPEEIGRAHV